MNSQSRGQKSLLLYYFPVLMILCDVFLIEWDLVTEGMQYFVNLVDSLQLMGSVPQ